MQFVICDTPKRGLHSYFSLIRLGVEGAIDTPIPLFFRLQSSFFSPFSTDVMTAPGSMTVSCFVIPV